jgi:hypothetical protein
VSESSCIDSSFRWLTMPKSYSSDLRERVIEAVETGASRREAAERFKDMVREAYSPREIAEYLAREVLEIEAKIKERLGPVAR